MSIIKKSKKNVSMLNLAVINGILLIVLFSTSCSKEQKEKVETRSLEQIYNDEGVPVRVIDIQETQLSNDMTFLATMSGIQETSVAAKIADKILTLPVRVGQAVEIGQIVATFPTDNASIQWEQAKTSLENATKTYNRMKNLLASGDIAQSNFDGAETQYLVAKQNFESLKQMVYIDAPFSGIVTAIPVKVGDKVNPGTALVTIAQIGTMIGRIWASEAEVVNLKIGMTATINIDNKEYKGRISTIALAMDSQRRAFQVDVNFANPKREIKSGTTCNLVFSANAANQNAIIIPRRFIKTNVDEKYVFVVDNDKARKVIVKTGESLGVNIEILSGLSATDKVVSEGISLLEDGIKVKIVS